MRVDGHGAGQPAVEEADSLLRGTLSEVLGLGAGRADAFTDDTPLFGALPELDSMAVAGLLTEIEDRFHIMIDDDDVDGETFESFGSLKRFIESKLG
jgi:acyl carrier protein